MTTEQINQAGALLDNLIAEAPVKRNVHFAGIEALKKLLEKANMANELNKQLDESMEKELSLLKELEELKSKNLTLVKA